LIAPILPIKNAVLFPRIAMPLSVGRPLSIAALEAALAEDSKTVIVVAQRTSSLEEPGFSDLYTVGTRAIVKTAIKSADRFDVAVQGVERVRLTGLTRALPFLEGEADDVPVRTEDEAEVEALRREMLEKVSAIQELLRGGLLDLGQMLSSFHDPLDQAYLVASLLGLDVDREQILLEAPTAADALRLMVSFLTHEEQIVRLRQKITDRAAAEMTKEQRDYFLRQQLRAIQQELGETTPEEGDIALLRDRARNADLPEEVRKEVASSLDRLARLPSISPDHQVTRTWLDLVLELPWKKSTVDRLDLSSARSVLDEDHFDLEPVKKRILEHLAVMKLNPKAKAPILCFVGPPGVGKTSLGQSIARALGRSFERTSLGGMHDEAELRGHRRTYVGALAGRIIQAIRRAGVRNPLLMLDEVDKLGRDFRGDPSAALMEVLDPAQNFGFRDNYLDLPFDLSNVFFITTANSLESIPAPLLDRMEVLRLSGYTEEEKVAIARRWLLPRQLTQSGLKPEQVSIPDETIRAVIRRHTREAGVRQLERCLGRIARRVAIGVTEGKTGTAVIGEADLVPILGPGSPMFEEMRPQLPPGTAAGLAWTESGGEVLYVESVLLPGRDELVMTGHLGDVMKESVQAALSYVSSKGPLFGWAPPPRRTGVHVHVPSGAVPKDGPSAGLAIVVALASLFSGQPAQADTAMTGEITLSGLILPIGGVKEKLLAARRAGMKRVLLPKGNDKDLSELPAELKGSLELVLLDQVDDAILEAIPKLAERLHLAARRDH
jgi:ATP-dependent Lon protease